MNKQVLAFKKTDLALPARFAGFFDAASYKNMADLYGGSKEIKEILDVPVSLVDEITDGELDDYSRIMGYFTVTARGSKGNMAVCYQHPSGKYSIGFGGYIRSLPDGSLKGHISQNIQQTINAELKMQIAQAAFANTLDKCYYLEDQINPDMTPIIALCGVVNYPRMFELDENSKLANLHWEPIENLRSMKDSGLLDPWAERVLPTLLNDY